MSRNEKFTGNDRDRGAHGGRAQCGPDAEGGAVRDVGKNTLKFLRGKYYFAIVKFPAETTCGSSYRARAANPLAPRRHPPPAATFEPARSSPPPPVSSRRRISSSPMALTLIGPRRRRVADTLKTENFLEDLRMRRMRARTRHPSSLTTAPRGARPPQTRPSAHGIRPFAEGPTSRRIRRKFATFVIVSSKRVIMFASEELDFVTYSLAARQAHRSRSGRTRERKWAQYLQR
ncbi:hypothetical protein EVAR_37159_1 [Eumeta japonica]|uniref:Uncharacterized protein n=1 Tax=Eumeta variegata TaxID=151549 RepID=A0A4C1WKJ3_EUMVA|nr:hypothetical protein EVAR_37159_1 [Eumeta japonica]